MGFIVDYLCCIDFLFSLWILITLLATNNTRDNNRSQYPRLISLDVNIIFRAISINANMINALFVFLVIIILFVMSSKLQGATNN